MKEILVTIDSCRKCPFSHGERGEFCKQLGRNIGWQKIGEIHCECPLEDFDDNVNDDCPECDTCDAFAYDYICYNCGHKRHE